MKKSAMPGLGAAMLAAGLVWMIALAVVTTAPQMTIFPAVILAGLGAILVLIREDPADDVLSVDDGSLEEPPAAVDDRRAA